MPAQFWVGLAALFVTVTTYVLSRSTFLHADSSSKASTVSFAVSRDLQKTSSPVGSLRRAPFASCRSLEMSS